MKKIISLCLFCVLIASVCASTAACSPAGLTLPSNITTQPTGSTSLSVTTEITTSVTTSAATTQATTSAPKPPPDLSKIAQIALLDFRTKTNKWAEKDKEGNYKYTKFKESDYVDKYGNPGGDYYPFALYLPQNSRGLDYSFNEGGETLKLTSTNADNPCIAFECSRLKTYLIGKESDGRAEYVKIRFKNSSSATKLSFMGTNPSFANGSLDKRISATIDILPNSDEWQTITLSMVEGTVNSSYNITKFNTWNSYLTKFAIYPFGFGNDCEATVGAEIEIDYVIFGSSEYVNSYSSKLEKSAS